MLNEAKLIYRNRQGAEIEVVFQELTLKETELEITSKEEETAKGKVASIVLKAKDAVELVDFQVKANPGVDIDARMLANGFQSWSTSREMGRDDRIEPLFPPAGFAAETFGDYQIVNSSGKKGLIHSWTYTYFRNPKKPFLLLGSVDEYPGYTVFEHNFDSGLLVIKRDCLGAALNAGDEYVLLKLYYGWGKENELFDSYFSKWKLPRKDAPHRTGWTSWYNYYKEISEDIVYSNLEAIDNRGVKLDYFQIDDGYQQAVGDWLEVNDKFPGGMKKVAGAIRDDNMQPGLWLAPFICEKESNLYKDKPHWLLWDENGEPVKAGWNPLWSGNFYALDFYADGVQDYLKKVFDTVSNDWGYKFIKLDFLYAAAMRPRQGKTRGQIMCEVMDFLHQIAGDCILLGCGVPLGPAFGKVDYCRVGSDVGPFWEFYTLKAVGARERVSTISSLQSTLGRHQLDGRAFRNDPDVFILRDELSAVIKDRKIGLNKNKLSNRQRYTLFMANHLLGGLVFFSDNVADYDDEQLDLLLSAYPLPDDRKVIEFSQHGRVYQVRFEAARSEYLALINLEAKSYTVRLRKEPYFHPDLFVLSKGDAVTLKPFQSICLRKAEPRDDRSYVLGASGHIFPGVHIGRVVSYQRSINVKLRDYAAKDAMVYIAVPAGQKSLKVNGEEHIAAFRDGVNYVAVHAAYLRN